MSLAEGLDTIATPDSDGTRVSGDLRTVLRAVKDGTSARTLIVDLDGTDYAGGGLHELAQWCTADTLVIAIGSDASAERTPVEGIKSLAFVLMQSDRYGTP